RQPLDRLVGGRLGPGTLGTHRELAGTLCPRLARQAPGQRPRVALGRAAADLRVEERLVPGPVEERRLPGLADRVEVAAEAAGRDGVVSLSEDLDVAVG